MQFVRPDGDICTSSQSPHLSQGEGTLQGLILLCGLRLSAMSSMEAHTYMRLSVSEMGLCPAEKATCHLKHTAAYPAGQDEPRCFGF